MTVQGTQKLSTIEDVFALRSPAAVREHLDAHPGIAELLSRVPEHARRRFGADVRFVLDMRQDRDGSGPPELFAYIVTSLSADEAWDRMVELEETWWFDVVGDEKVYLHVEFA